MTKKYRNYYGLLFMLLIIAAVTLYPRTAKADDKGISIRKSKVTLYVGADKVSYRRFIMSPKLSGISGTVKYKTSSKKIAKVNSKGYVYAVSPGTAVVIAYLKDNGKLYTARCKVVVKKPEIVFGQDQLNLKVGESTNISWNLTPPGTIKWSVRNSKRVSIDSNGTATGLKAGGTFIYAEANGVKKRLLVKVTADENQPVVTPTPTPTPADLEKDAENSYKSFLTSKGYDSYFTKSAYNFKYAFLDINKDGLMELIVEASDAAPFQRTSLFRYNNITGNVENVPLPEGTKKENNLYHYSTVGYSDKYSCLSYSIVRNFLVESSLLFVKYDGKQADLYKFLHKWDYHYGLSSSTGYQYEINNEAVSEAVYNEHVNSISPLKWVSLS